MSRLPARKQRCACCGNIGGQTHHRHPLSQNGTDDDANRRAVCDSCHEMYNRNNQTLSPSSVQARVQNFLRWFGEWPGARMEFCGKRTIPDPWCMAPDCVCQEVADFFVLQKYVDHSGRRFSNIGKVWEPEQREFPKTSR